MTKVCIWETKESCKDNRSFVVGILKDDGYGYTHNFSNQYLYYQKAQALRMLKHQLREKLGVKRLKYYGNSL